MQPPSNLIGRLVVQNVLYVAGMGALLLVPAGTLDWPAVWHFALAMAVLGLASGLWLEKIDPALLAERMRPMMQRDQPSADKRFMVVFGTAALIWFITMGLEARNHVPHPSLERQALGLALLVGSTTLIMWVMRTNSFAIPIVKVQTERSHHVVSGGPYAWVRHPMYSATFLFFCGVPLMLGSSWGLMMAPLFIALFAVRAVIEERTLLAGLSGYATYVAKVRYRLVPGIW